MKLSKGLIFFALAALSVAQSRHESVRPLRQPVRGVHGAVDFKFDVRGRPCLRSRVHIE